VAESDDAGAVYADFIETELVDQRASKASTEQRCIAVVSTSGILVTVLFGFAAIARKSYGLHIPPRPAAGSTSHSEGLLSQPSAVYWETFPGHTEA
jgi:hypothetical protein